MCYKSETFSKTVFTTKTSQVGFQIVCALWAIWFCIHLWDYSGKENVVGNNEPDLGASSNVVVRLCRAIERNKNYQVYFDNYYTSLGLISYLSKQGIHSLATINRNRIPNSKLPTEQEMKKRDCGDSFEFVGVVDNVEISITAWKDNKTVVLASSFLGQLPLAQVQRYDKNQQQRISVTCPAVVQEYNKHMGGVDLHDSFMGRYNIIIRSKKWYFRIFYHLIDVIVINAWLLYKRAMQENAKSGKSLPSKILQLWEFRLEIAGYLGRRVPCQ